MSTEEQMLKAKSLIQQKRYDDARALLVTIDHPKADVWLDRLNQMERVKQPPTVMTIQQPQAEKTFTVQLFITIVLLFFWVIPGIIALAIFGQEARKYPDAPGAGALIMLNKLFYRFQYVLIVLVIIGAIATLIWLPTIKY